MFSDTEGREDFSKEIVFLLHFFFKDFIHERGRDTEGEAGSTQGARRGTQSPDPGSCPGPKADAHPLSHPGVPGRLNLRHFHMVSRALQRGRF